MKYISFMLKEEIAFAVGNDAEDTLANVSKLTGVVKAYQIKPDTTRAIIYCMCMASAVDDADLEVLVKNIKEISNIENAWIPVDRTLL